MEFILFQLVIYFVEIEKYKNNLVARGDLVATVTSNSNENLKFKLTNDTLFCLQQITSMKQQRYIMSLTIVEMKPLK